ncbi:hypothetical protein [Streptomyces hygroscopicus]|uniref:hypothetical protein n=1 Tax=Streptomyces hygroscopicus TaxID=1912 RepID=UPI0036D028B4
MTHALQERGVPDPAARLAAGLGVLAFHRAVARWSHPGNQRAFADLAREALQEPRPVTAALG